MPSPAWSLLARVWGPEVVVRRRCRRSWRSSGPGCQGRPALGCRGWGHPARAGTFLCGRGRPARPGTGLLSPTASNAPARKDTHPATWNVPVVGDGLLDGVPRRSRMHPEVRGLHPRGPCSWPQVRSRRRAGSVVRAYGVAGGRQGASATDPGTAVRTHGMPEDRRGASRRAGPAVHPGLTVIVTTRSHRKDVTGVPGQESLEHQSSERRGHPSHGAMDRQALSRRRCWRSHRQDWGYPAAAAAGCCCYCCCCCHCLYRRRP